MKSAVDMGLSAGRGGARLLRLVGELIRGAASALLPMNLKPEIRDRVLWLHRICRRILPIFNVELQIEGTIPARGLLVANHLSYLDIIVLASLKPCVFVAKTEVKSWPVFGWFARKAGTILVDRRCRRDAVRAAEAIRAALDLGALVVLFAEGTSSDGDTVRPFKSSLLEAARSEPPNSKSGIPISVAALHYELRDGDAAQEVCYWGRHTLVPHLLKLLSRRGVKASLAFAEVGNPWRDRKQLAQQLHTEVAALHAELRSERSAGLRTAALRHFHHAGSDTGAQSPELTTSFAANPTAHL